MSDSPRSRKSGRSHVTTACIACRASKLKCDGKRPQCSRCVRKGTQCEFPVGEDKRKVSLQNAIPFLLNRINELSQFIEQQGLKVPPMNVESRSVLHGLLNTNPSVSPPPSTGVDSSSREITQSSPPQQPLSWPLDDPSLGHVQYDQKADATYLSSFTDPDFATSQTPEYGLPSVFRDNNIGPLAGGAILNSGAVQDAVVENSANLFWDSLQPMDSISNDILDLDLFKGLTPNRDEEKDASMLLKPPTTTTVPPSSQAENASSCEEDEDDVITSLSARLGVFQLAADGQLRYYGATSNFNLLKISPDPNQNLDIRSIRKNGQEILERAKVGAAISQELEDHVINLYFTWQDPSYHVVDRDMFESAKRRWDSGADGSPYYSDVLKNAMCALGSAFEARFHPSFPTFPKPLAEYFGDRAKALLDLELDSPTVATVQALVILSSHEAAQKRDARGWLYSGMALRLAHDLGLHVDDTESVRLGQITAAEAAARRTAFWGCFVNTHLWSFYLGRDFRVTSGEISVQRPSPNPHDLGMWRAYSSGGTFIGNQSNMVNPLGLVSLQWVLLCEMVGPMAHVLYGCIEISKPDLQTMCEKVTDQLWSWKATLSPELQIDITRDDLIYLPHVLMLHMQYHSFLIFAHRPWTSKISIQPFPPQGAGPDHARQVCIDSAVSVSKILRIYEKHYSFRLINIQAVHIIFTSIPVLIFATLSTGEVDLAEHLGTCFRALEVLGSVFESAKRAHGYLLAMQRVWPGMNGRRQVAKRRKLT